MSAPLTGGKTAEYEDKENGSSQPVVDHPAGV